MTLLRNNVIVKAASRSSWRWLRLRMLPVWKHTKTKPENFLALFQLRVTT